MLISESKSLSPVISSLRPSPDSLTGRTIPKKSVVFHPFDQKSTFLCKFCGGKSCKHENWLTHPESAIKGLNSDWISNNILAMQRPSSRIIKEFNIVSQFKEKCINAIFNLQEPGEHPFCGDGIHATSGFSYYPEEFSDHGIYFFNFGWRDMTATSTDVILKIVKQMSFSLTNGSKVAVHCHAGRGRTGLIIAAWLIFHENMTAKDAIKQMRTRRKDAISKTSQEKILYQFEKEIKESRLIFFPSPKYSLEEYLYHQKNLCALSLGSAERYVPRIVLIALERLDTLIQSNVCRIEDVLASFYVLDKKECFKEEWGSNHERFLKQFKERINVDNYEVSDIEDPRYLTQILLDFLDGFSSSAIEQRFINAIQSNIHETKARLTKDIKDQFFKELNKKEFFLLECFARFFASILAQSENSNAEIVNATLRVCISLLGSKKKLDKLFLKRNLIKDHNQDDQVTHLKIFLLKWIENFNEEFTELFMLHKSPLRINERQVTQKMIRKGIRMNSYLSKVLDAESKQDLDKEIETPIEPSIIHEVQEEREIASPDLKGPKKPLLSPTDEHKISPAGSVTQKANNAMRIRLIHLSEAGVPHTAKSSNVLPSTQFATPRGNVSKKTMSILPSLSPDALIHSNGETPKAMSDRAKANTLISPKTERVSASSRKTLIKVGNDRKTQENVSSLAKLNIEKHYDDLFGDNKVGSLDSLDPCSLARIPSIGKETGAVQGIIDQIKKLSADQQDMVLQSLLEMQASRNSKASKALF